MNLALPTGPLAQAIGWALLHLVWQGALAAAVLAVVLARLSGRRASLRYAVSCATLLTLVGLGVATGMGSYRAATATAPSPSPAAAPALAPPAGVVLAAQLPGQSILITRVFPAPSDRVRSFVRAANDALPVIVTVWLAGVAILSLRLILAWLRARRLVARGATRAREHWQAAARRLSDALGVRHAVRLLESAAVEVPSVIGLVRPVILLPASALTGLTPAQLEMILAHELAHIRRHDFLVNLLQAVVETLLFYHPAVWWVSRQIRIERENCCDDLAVAVCGDPVHYARALTRLEELRAPALRIAVSAAGGSLFQRVRRLVGGTTRSTGLAVRGATALAVLAGVLLAFAAQSFSAIGRHEPALERPRVDVGAGLPAATDPAEPREAAAFEPAEPEKSAVAVPASEEQAAPPDVTSAASEDDPNAVPEDEEVAPDDELPTLEELIALRTQGVTPEMVHEMRSLFPGVGYMEIASMRAVGVTPEFVREMRRAGIEVESAGDAQSLAALGVTRDYVRGMRAAGFPVKTAGDAAGLMAVGVTPDYVREMRATGLQLDDAGDLRSLRAVGVTPDYVRDLRKAGLELERADEAQSLRALGITPAFVRSLANAGYRDLTVDQLTRLGAAGVTGDFIREMRKYRSR